MSATELADIRAAFAATLPDTCTVESPVYTLAADGTRAQTWEVRGTAVPCRLVAVTGRDFPQLTAEQVTAGRYWRFEFAAAQTVAVRDRLTVSEQEYHVLQTNAAQSELFKLVVLAERRS